MTTTCFETQTRKPANQTINFTVGTCPLGLVLVASTSHGVCAILLGGKEETLVRQLRAIFPEATLQEGSKELDQVLNSVVQSIETPTAALVLPLDMRGTPFQRQVWQAVREIPPGQTATYQEIALKLGSTAQEIGEACAANTLAVVVPCHRVIRSDGGLAGYRWGVNRKRLLLQREQEVFPIRNRSLAITALAVGSNKILNNVPQSEFGGKPAGSTVRVKLAWLRITAFQAAEACVCRRAPGVRN